MNEQAHLGHLRHPAQSYHTRTHNAQSMDPAHWSCGNHSSKWFSMHRHFVGENRNKFSLRHWCGRWCILILFFSLFSLFFSILFAFGSVIKTIVRSEPNRQTIQQCAVHCRRRRHHRWNCTNWNFFLIVIFVFDVEIYPVSRREREKWNEREAIMKFTKRNFQVPLFGNSNNGISIWIEYAIRNLTQRKYKPKSN